MIGVMFESWETMLVLQSKETHFERVGKAIWNSHDYATVRDRLTKEDRKNHGLKSPVQYALEQRGDVVIA